MMHITAHAISRYRERVAAVSEAEARKALSSKAIETANNFGAHFVKLGTGHRIVIDQGSVITVLPSDHASGRLSLARDERFQRA